MPSTWPKNSAGPSRRVSGPGPTTNTHYESTAFDDIQIMSSPTVNSSSSTRFKGTAFDDKDDIALLEEFVAKYRGQTPGFMRAMGTASKAKISRHFTAFVASGDIKGAYLYLKSKAVAKGRYDLGASGSKLIPGTSYPVLESYSIVKIVDDVRRHRLSPTHPDHLPYMPLSSVFFSEKELKRRLVRIMDLFIDFAGGHVISEVRLVERLYDEVYDDRDFKIAALGGLSPYDLVAILKGRRAPNYYADCIRMLQDLTWERMDERGLTRPQPRAFLSPRHHSVNEFYFFDQPHVLALEEISPQDEKQALGFAKRLLAQGVPRVTTAATMLFELGIAESIGYGRGGQSKFGQLALSSASSAMLPLEERVSYIQSLRIGYLDNRQHPNVTTDRRFMWSEYSPQEILEEGWERCDMGPSSQGLARLAALTAQGDHLGCCYPACMYSQVSMHKHGITDGQWCLDPLKSSLSNPICCRRHYLVATFLTDNEALALPFPLAVAIMGDEEATLAVVKGGSCPTRDCVSQGVYGLAICEDPSGQNMAVCPNCNQWWAAEMENVKLRGQQARAKGLLYAIRGRREAESEKCSSCPNVCATPGILSSATFYGRYGYVDRQGNTCCRTCFIKFGGYRDIDHIRSAHGRLFTDANRPLFNETLEALCEVAHDKDACHSNLNAHAVMLAPKLYNRPASVGLTRRLIVYYMTCNHKRVRVQMFLRQIERWE